MGNKISDKIFNEKCDIKKKDKICINLFKTFTKKIVYSYSEVSVINQSLFIRDKIYTENLISFFNEHLNYGITHKKIKNYSKLQEELKNIENIKGTFFYTILTMEGYHVNGVVIKHTDEGKYMYIYEPHFSTEHKIYEKYEIYKEYEIFKFIKDNEHTYEINDLPKIILKQKDLPLCYIYVIHFLMSIYFSDDVSEAYVKYDETCDNMYITTFVRYLLKLLHEYKKINDIDYYILTDNTYKVYQLLSDNKDLYIQNIFYYVSSIDLYKIIEKRTNDVNICYMLMRTSSDFNKDIFRKRYVSYKINCIINTTEIEDIIPLYEEENLFSTKLYNIAIKKIKYNYYCNTFFGGYSLLHLVSGFDDLKTFKLIEKNTVSDLRNIEDKSVLYIATECNCLNIVTYLIKDISYSNEKNHKNQTLLHISTYYSYYVLKYFIDNFTLYDDLTIYDNYMSYKEFKTNMYIIEALIEKCNILEKDIDGFTAFDYIFNCELYITNEMKTNIENDKIVQYKNNIRNHNMSIINIYTNFIINNIDDINYLIDYILKLFVLHKNDKNNFSEIEKIKNKLEKLLKIKKNINDKNDNGYTNLYKIINFAYKDIFLFGTMSPDLFNENNKNIYNVILILVDAFLSNDNIDLNLIYHDKLDDTNLDDSDSIKSGNSILDMSVMGDMKEIVEKLLLKKNLNINLQDDLGNTVLMKSQLNDSLKLLFNNKNLNVNITNNRGETALFISIKNNMPTKSIFLIERGADIKIKNKNNQSILSYITSNAKLVKKYDVILKFLKEMKLDYDDVIGGYSNNTYQKKYLKYKKKYLDLKFIYEFNH
jgi:hypothetical protein